VDYSNRINPSKRRKFRGYTDSQGNYHDIDWTQCWHICNSSL
jgi:hypothetical protein